MTNYYGIYNNETQRWATEANSGIIMHFPAKELAQAQLDNLVLHQWGENKGWTVKMFGTPRKKTARK